MPKLHHPLELFRDRKIKANILHIIINCTQLKQVCEAYESSQQNSIYLRIYPFMHQNIRNTIVADNVSRHHSCFQSTVNPRMNDLLPKVEAVLRATRLGVPRAVGA